MPGESIPQGLWLPPRVATLFVAANDALDRSRAQADYLCDGVADDVQINEALNALPAGVQGRVVLSEGTFNIVDPITIPANNITLRGQGRSTFIDGDGLATGEHGIVLSGFTNCTIKKLAIQTQDGGGKNCHCIFIEDGANSFEIEYVTIVNSDSDGIAIEGTNIVDGCIHNCHIDDVDDYGIAVSMDNGNSMLRLHIYDNFVTGAGNVGIALWNGVGVGTTSYCNISENIVYLCGAEGIIAWDSDYGVVSNNISILNGSWGIHVRDSEHVNLSNNLCYANESDGILLQTANECIVEGNICVGSVVYDGIQIEGTNNTITGNHCCENFRHGIHLLPGATQCNVVGNICLENNQHGINVRDVENKISGNYCHDNNQDAKYGAASATLPNNLVDTTLNQFGAVDIGKTVWNTTDNTYATVTVIVSANTVTLSADIFTIGENYIMYRDYNGINLAEGADKCQVNDNFCNSPGDSQVDGIHLDDGAIEVQIVGNYCTNGLSDGIELAANNDNCLVKDNYCSDNQGYGIVIGAGSDACIVANNKLAGNITGAISDGGTDTVLPCIFVPCPNPSGNIGTHPAEQLTDGEAVLSRFEAYIPADFVELVRAQILIVPLGAGDLVAEVATNSGKICSAQDYNANAGAIAEAVLATVVANDLECVDISGGTAFTGLAAQHSVGVAFTRHGENVNDTIDANVWLLGLRLQYV